MSAARARIHAMFPLDAQATTELDVRLDALVAEALGEAADDLHDQVAANRGRALYGAGLHHAEVWLRDRAGLSDVTGAGDRDV